jgi:hypothetical protein
MEKMVLRPGLAQVQGYLIYILQLGDAPFRAYTIS